MGVCASDTSPEEEDDEELEETFRKPLHYRGREGPKYRILNFTSDYEYRQYEPSTWICVRQNNIDQYKKVLNKGSTLLSKYFQGSNGPEKIMVETCPLRIHVDFKQDLESPGDFVVSLHLPYENCARPPAPKHPDMFIQDFPEQLAYVLKFEGVPDESELKEHFNNLISVLENERIPYERIEYFTTRFESPFSLKKKMNEVIVLARSDT